MRIHKEGKNILVIGFVILIVINLVAIDNYNLIPNQRYSFLIASSLVYAWMFFFFRDPNRNIQIDDRVVLAPADGKVLKVEELYEEEYFKGPCLKVSVFMSPFSVHVNRFPISGKIVFFKYHPGKNLLAFHPKSSTKNERTTVVVESEKGVQILFRQIAGFLAKRVKFYYKEGDEIEQGSECGFIKFGSQVDIYLPQNTLIMVKEGEYLKGGVSILAQIG